MSTVIKLKRGTSTPTTSDIVNGEVAIDTSAQKLYINDSGTIKPIGESLDLSAVSQDIIPDGNGTRDLGSSTKRFAELYLSGNTINLGGATIDSDGSGTISISAGGVTLPADSKIEDGTRLALEGDDGTPARSVAFFTAAGGLSSRATTFRFKATTANTYTFTAYTLADGSSITQDTGTTLFTF